MPAQIASDAQSIEITAVPKLLEMLSLKGNIMTVDALNCQREVAQQIVDRRGHCVPALTADQATLHADAQAFLGDRASALSTADPVVDGDYGQIETRTAIDSSDIGWLHQAPR